MSKPVLAANQTNFVRGICQRLHTLHLTRMPWDVRVLIAICIAAMLPRLLLLGIYSAEFDEGVYWQSLRAMAAGHPLYSSIYSSQPPLFLALVYPFYLLIGQSLAAARLAIALGSLVGIVALFVAGRLLSGPWAGLLAAALLALDPVYQHASVTLEAEGLSVALSALAVALAIAASKAAMGPDVVGRWRWFALASGVMLAAAILTKLFAIVALVPVAIYLGEPIFTTFLADDRGVRRPSRAKVVAGLRDAAPTLGWGAVGLVGATGAILLPFVPSWDALTAQAIGYHLAAGQVSSAGLRAQLRTVWDAEWWLPLVLPAIAAMALLVWRRWWVLATPLLWAAASLVLLLRQQPLFAHHVVLLSPPLALAGGVALARAARELRHVLVRLPRWGGVPLVRTLMLALLALTLVVGLARSGGTVMAARQYVPTTQLEMAIALEARTPPGSTVITDDPYVAALADRDVPPELVDTSNVRIATGYLTTAELQAIIMRSNAHVILFASGRFDQLRGFHAWVAARFTKAFSFGGSDALYVQVAQGLAPAQMSSATTYAAWANGRNPAAAASASEGAFSASAL
jgi:hypothetical protein